MATVEEGLQAQIRNIERTYGRSMDEWAEVIRTAGLQRHGQIVAMLKADHGLTHGAANRVALVVLAKQAPATGADPIDALHAGSKAAARPIFERLMGTVHSFGADLEIAHKKGYVSLRRRTQFGMLQPAAGRVDVGLVLPGTATTGRLEPAATFNALFTHRVRVGSLAEVDDELVGWLRRAYDRAG
ncbi:MAG TPA: DUF4287 domain-containing protein [Candidatus Limnocylindrales bacterium]